MRISYQAAEGEIVKIKGSERYQDWTLVSGNTWQRTFTPAEFGGYNPYLLIMDGAMVGGESGTVNRKRGEVFLDGLPLEEMVSLAQVQSKARSWAASSDGLTVYANFGGANPNNALAEVVMREQVFAPATWNLGYIHVKGFIIEHSANGLNDTDYTEQAPSLGALSTSGGHDWLIEDVLIQFTKSFGLDLGLGGAEASLSQAGWNMVPALYGRHTLRDSVLRDIGTGGIHAYKGPFCTIERNRFIRCNRLDAGSAEKAAVKFVWFGNDVVIRENYFYKNNIGGGFSAIWLDAGTQGARVSRNVFVDNDYVWFERQLGPVVFDNNILLNTNFRISDGGGTLIAHNFVARLPGEDPRNDYWRGGAGDNGTDNNPNNNFVRYDSYGYISPAYFEPHTMNQLGNGLTKRARLHFRNNIIIGDLDLCLPPTNAQTFENYSNYNVLLGGASKSTADANSVQSAYNPGVTFQADDNGVTLSFTMNGSPFGMNAPFLTHAFIGELNRFVSHPIADVDQDFFGLPISAANPIPGPFADLATGARTMTIFEGAPTAGERYVDGDGDGQTAEEEFLWGTSDGNASDRFKPLVTLPTGGPVTISWNALGGRSYKLLRSFSLQSGSWQTIFNSGPLTADETLEILDLPADGSDSAFYKIEVAR